MRMCILLLIYTYFAFFSCRNNVVETDEGYQYQVPPVTDDGWETASLASVGMDATRLENLMNKLDDISLHHIHSLLIVKDGKLVFEAYFSGDKFNLAQYMGERGFDRDDTHNLCSATKSFTSALMGIAIDQSLIRSVDEKVFDFFPEYAYLLVNADEKRQLTIKHLLTMTSGLEWDDETLPYSDPQNDMNRMKDIKDIVGDARRQALEEYHNNDSGNCSKGSKGGMVS